MNDGVPLARDDNYQGIAFAAVFKAGLAGADTAFATGIATGILLPLVFNLELSHEGSYEGAGMFAVVFAPLEVVQFLRLGFPRVYEHESLSLWESRALRPGEGPYKWGKRVTS